MSILPLVALGLGAAQLLPSLEYMRLSSRASIGFQRAGGGFVPSDLLALDRVIGWGESISIDGVAFDIPTGQLSDEQVKTTWLAFQIVDELVSEQGASGPGSCYVHTESFLGGTSHGFPP